MKKLFRQVLCLMLMAMASAAVQADIVVVVSVENHNKALTAEQVSRIFLGKIGTFPNGEQAIPIDQPKGRGRDWFYRKVAGKTGVQLSAYWSRLTFTGAGMPPIEAESEDEVVSTVADNPNTVGYVDASKVNKRVKVLYTVPYKP